MFIDDDKDNDNDNDGEENEYNDEVEMMIICWGQSIRLKEITLCPGKNVNRNWTELNTETNPTLGLAFDWCDRKVKNRTVRQTSKM